MSLKDWLVRETIRRRLTLLGLSLSELSADYETVRAVSSKTVADRMKAAGADYWRAVDAFAHDRLTESKRAIAAAFLQVEFVRKLMSAEVAERELGEGVLFEMEPAGAGNAAVQRVQSNLNRLTVEVAALAAEVKALAEGR